MNGGAPGQSLGSQTASDQRNRPWSQEGEFTASNGSIFFLWCVFADTSPNDFTLSLHKKGFLLFLNLPWEGETKKHLF